MKAELVNPPAKREPQVLVEALPERLHRALHRELCPGERVEGVYISAQLKKDRWRRAAIASRPWWVRPALHTGRVLHGLANRWLLGTDFVYAVTHERCFFLSLSGIGAQIRDIHEPPGDSRLERADRVRLRVDFTSLQDKLARTGRSLAVRNATRISDLPVPLRNRLELFLKPDEEVLWVDRPRAREYFMRAPLDLTCVFGFLVGFALFAVALFPELRVTAATGGLLLWLLATLKLAHQVRGTVYALTDRRGLVLIPGQGPTEYELSEMRRFQRRQDDSGVGALAPTTGPPAAGFHGVRDVKDVEDLLKQRPVRDRANEVTPAVSPDGRGDEISAHGRGEATGDRA